MQHLRLIPFSGFKVKTYWVPFNFSPLALTFDHLCWCTIPGVISTTPPGPSDDSLSITSEDSYYLSASQQDLRHLHTRMVEERKKEQEVACKEQQRLDDILNICADYQREMEEELMKQHQDGSEAGQPGVSRSDSR